MSDHKKPKATLTDDDMVTSPKLSRRLLIAGAGVALGAATLGARPALADDDKDAMEKDPDDKDASEKDGSGSDHGSGDAEERDPDDKDASEKDDSSDDGNDAEDKDQQDGEMDEEEERDSD